MVKKIVFYGDKDSVIEYRNIIKSLGFKPTKVVTEGLGGKIKVAYSETLIQILKDNFWYTVSTNKNEFASPWNHRIGWCFE